MPDDKQRGLRLPDYVQGAAAPWLLTALASQVQQEVGTGAIAPMLDMDPPSVKRSRSPHHCLECGHLAQIGPYVRYHVQMLPRAQKAAQRLGDRSRRGHDPGQGGGTSRCSCPEEFRRKPVSAATTAAKRKFGSDCSCEGDADHPGGCKETRRTTS